VHIVRPEPSPFVREQKPTTASVMVKVRGGAMLNRSTVTAISSLVAGSIEGLAKENVRIVDQNGRLLSEERDPDSGMFGSASDARREVEEYRSRRAEAMLESVLGSGKAIVRVTAELDMKIVKKKQEIINAEARTPKMEKSVSTKSNTTSNQAANKGGPAGSSGPAKGNTTTTGSSGVNSSSETTQTEYVVPSTFIEELKKPGAIERLTVAVFIDSDAFKKSDPPISLESLKDAIKNAVGFKSDRDEIQVTLVRMPSTAPETNEEEAAATARMQTILTIVRNVSIGAIALCVMPIVWMLFRRRKHVAVPAPATSPQIQRITEELDRNPDALAKILTLWIDRADASERKAA
jgi:flagellar M-ring protein FliF